MRAATTTEKETRYILITECLQNDLFLNPECRLFLRDDAVRQLLVAKNDHDAYDVDDAPRKVPAERSTAARSASSSTRRSASGSPATRRGSCT